MVCLSRPYHIKLFKGCLLQLLLGPFWISWPICMIVTFSLFLMLFDTSSLFDNYLNWVFLHLYGKSLLKVNTSTLIQRCLWWFWTVLSEGDPWCLRHEDVNILFYEKSFMINLEFTHNYNFGISANNYRAQ